MWKLKPTRLALIGLCSGIAAGADAAVPTLFDAKIWNAVLVEVVTSAVSTNCPEKQVKQARLEVALDHYAEEAGLDIRTVARSDRESDIGVVVNAIRDGREEGLRNSISRLGAESFCTGAEWMFGSNGLVFSGIITDR